MHEELFLPLRGAPSDAGQPAEEALGMNEAEFRSFYDRTSSPLWSYLCRVLGNAGLADDLMQESYVRILRSPNAPVEETHRKNYLFRIATNLLRDHFRAARRRFVPLPDLPSPVSMGRGVELESDMKGILEELAPRDRELLWLAYVEGYEHKEIAGMLRCGAASIRPMLFRARQRLASLLHARGWPGKPKEEKS